MDSSFDDMYDDYSDEDEELSDHFDTGVGDSVPLTTELEQNWTIMTPDEIVDMQIDQIGKVRELMDVSPAIARILLQAHKWDLDRLQNKYFEDSDACFRDVGLSVDEETARKSLTTVTSDDECYMCGKLDLHDNEKHCLVCHVDYPPSDIVSLVCGHCFCKECWANALRIAIIDDGKPSSKLTCLAHMCDVMVDETTVKDLISKKEPEAYARYTRNLIESYVEDNPYMKWCPGTDCPNAALGSLQSAAHMIECTCGARWCFVCGAGCHTPATCPMMKEWKKKCEDDSETCNWISANTKDCPECGSAIEKNGGCNHINCKKCGYHFCWVCLEPFDHKTYNHSCNREKKQDGKMTSARASLERYMHYYTRYNTHMDSSRLESKFRQRVQAKMEAMQDQTTWIDVQFLKSASDVLLEARQVLAHSYVLGFYTAAERESKDLFEYLQEELERSTEQLSGMIEDDACTMQRSIIMNLTQNVSTRMNNMVEAIDGDGMVVRVEGGVEVNPAPKGGKGKEPVEVEIKEDEEEDEEEEKMLQAAIIASLNPKPV